MTQKDEDLQENLRLPMVRVWNKILKENVIEYKLEENKCNGNR